MGGSTGRMRLNKSLREGGVNPRMTWGAVLGPMLESPGNLEILAPGATPRDAAVTGLACNLGLPGCI